MICISRRPLIPAPAATRLNPMIFHASLPAREPERVARVLAELMEGRYSPFYRPNSFMAFSKKPEEMMIEVMPVAEAAFEKTGPARELYDSMHLAVGVDLTPQQVMAIGEREGWRTRRMTRGGSFDVIELWIEDHFLIEVLTPEMQADYVAGMKS
jgi:hypothetical protein